MTDIAKCKNKECPLAQKCYRFTSKANEFWQSYSGFKYDDGCDFFWDNRGE